MTCYGFVVRGTALVVRSAIFVVDSLILRPIQGVLDVCEGMVQIAPVLFRAVVDAAVDLIEPRLTRQGKNQLREGTDKIATGAWLLSVPASVIVLILVCRVSVGFWFLVLAAWGFMLSVDAEQLWKRCAAERSVDNKRPVGVRS